MTTGQSHSESARDRDALIRDRVREFLLSTFYVPDAALLSDDASLVEAGIVDSTGVLEIVAFVKSEFGVEVENAEVTPGNFDSIELLTRYVVGKTSQAGRA